MPSVLKYPENDEGWEYQHVPKMTLGLNLSVRPEDIDPGEMLRADNVRFEKNQVLVDTGYKKFGQVLRGNVRFTFQFFLKDGSEFLLAITNNTVYRWDGSAAQWKYISNGTSTTLSAPEASGQTVLSVTSETGFAAGEHVGIILDDGTEHQTTVASTAAGTITVDDALPSAAASGNAVTEAVLLAGVDGTPVAVDVMVSQNWLVFTNDVDIPKRFDGLTCEDVPNLPGTNFKAGAVVVFRDHLLFINTEESGTAHPQRVRWSDTGDPTNWSTGNASFNDLVEGEDFAIAGFKLGPYLIIYKERSIVRVEWVGLANELFNFTSVITGEGIASVDSVVDLGDEHIFFGKANIYSFKGGFNIDPLGEKVFYRVFGSKGALNPSASSRIQGVYIEELDEIWFFYPAQSDTFPKNILRYLVNEESWAERFFPTGLTGYGFYLLTDSVDWAGLVGDWSAQNFEWGSKTTLANTPTTQLCLGTQVMEYDYLQTTDDGVAIAYLLETGDFYLPQYSIKLDYVEMSVKGSPEILYSVDGGQNFESLGVLSSSNDYRKVRLFQQVVARKIRFRIKGTDTAFGLEWFAFNYAVESEW